MQTPSQAIERRSANYKPTLWQNDFIQSLSKDGYMGNIEETYCRLKEELREVIYMEKLLKDKLELIDSLQQLGVAYHFKKDIKCVLTEIHESMDQVLMSTRDDLHIISLLFRLLRMHGFNVSEDIFKNYMDNKDELKAELSCDIKATLSLYEASFLAKEGEERLEMARDLATNYLTDFLQSSKNTDSRQKEHVAHVLEIPLYRGIERVHTRWFIDQYKMYEHMRPAFVELAILDFNLVQKAYRKELKEISSSSASVKSQEGITQVKLFLSPIRFLPGTIRQHYTEWWTDLQLYKKLPFIRDRLVENYFGAVGFAPEPKHATFRKVQTRAVCFITTIDDIYDVYGSLDELEAFTYAVEQWDITSIEMLPEYMQLCLTALINTVNDDSYHVLKKKGLRIIPFLKKAWTDLCKAYLVEARWYHTKYQPTLEEYLENAWISISIPVLLTNTYFFNDDVTANDLEKFSQGYPNILRVCSTIARLYDDIGTSPAEIERGDVDKAIQCYMHDKSVTESVACQGITEMIWKFWKLMNSENAGDTAFHEYFINVALNIARMTQFLYQNVDNYAEPGHETKERVISVLLKPIEK